MTAEDRYSDLWPAFRALFRDAVYTDLTHAFAPGQPRFPSLPDEARTVFRNHRDHEVEVHRYDHVGQWGTHVDPPVHFIRGGRTLDRIPVAEMIRPLVVIDISARASGDPDAVPALEDIALTVGAGRFVVIVGPSGCGKTSLLMMMAGLRRQSSGTILCAGRPILEPDPDRVGVVFQEASLFPWLTALDNIEFPLSIRGAPRAERRERAQAMLEVETGYFPRLVRLHMRPQSVGPAGQFEHVSQVRPNGLERE